MRRPSLFSTYSTYPKQVKKTKFTKLHLGFAESCLDLLGNCLNYLSSKFKQNKYCDILLMSGQFDTKFRGVKISELVTWATPP
jgi:hypothetical protein